MCWFPLRIALPALTISLALTAAAPPSHAAQTSPACTQATAACTHWIAVGGGPQRTMVYATYPLDAPNAGIVRALVMVHGAGHNADHYFRTSLAAAFLAGALDDTLVIAPRFAAAGDRLATNEAQWPERGENWRSGGTLAAEPGWTSFDLMDEILRKLADKQRFPNLRHIVVAGHSAGGQFVTRYEMANRVHETLGVAVSYVVANPSSYAWPVALRPLPTGDADPAGADREALGPDAERVHERFSYGLFDASKAPNYDRWPTGLEHRTGYASRESDDQLRRQLVARPTTYLLGQVDVLPLGGFDSSPSAMAQGPTRRARGEAFYTYVTRTMGAKHAAMIVPECGHNDRCIFTTGSVLPVLFPPPR